MSRSDALTPVPAGPPGRRAPAAPATAPTRALIGQVASLFLIERPLDQTLFHVARLLARRLRLSSAVVLDLDAATNQLVARGVGLPPALEGDPPRIPVVSSLADRLWQAGPAPVAFAELERLEPRLGRLRGPGPAGVVALPMRGRSTLAGLLLLADDGARGDLTAIAPGLQPVAHHLALEIERKRDTDQLRFLRVSVDRAVEAIYWSTEDGRIVDANASACRMQGRSRAELLGAHIWELDPNFSEEGVAAFWRDLRARGALLLETENVRPDGTLVPVEVSANHVEVGGTAYNLAFVREISARRQAEARIRDMEQQLAQAQKLEAIGRLAGGVAHDFSNLLGVILGFGELLATRLDPRHEGREHLDEIMAAARRGAALTAQLLAVSRRQALQPRPIDLDALIGEMDRLLRRIIGEDISLVVSRAPDIGLVHVDPAQLEQVLMNLAINARDAMADGGTLTIATAAASPAEAEAAGLPAAQAADCVCLSVSDTGHGMDERTRERLFEPFFTTKRTGTGLGLATVYGVIRQTGGAVRVHSSPGEGTRFDVFLPRATAEPAPAAATAPAAAVLAGEPVFVLLVEDQEPLRRMLALAMREHGFVVHDVATPDQALDALKPTSVRLDVLLTDVVMPGMSGRELADRVTAARPGIGVLFMSGYPSDVLSRHGALDPAVRLLQKPFSIDVLIEAVRQAVVPARP